eukprot:TRINITY_DN3494_c0_g1_i1.p1 TRINITY_DN3494_c0_g1~~TRINITY_DN3494_c0_g1_i1.p1  ORF type:complete len:984 (-),score=441.59 TRINITY_DN3494_c0_g1_i1:35-2545(-)
MHHAGLENDYLDDQSYYEDYQDANYIQDAGRGFHSFQFQQQIPLRESIPEYSNAWNYEQEQSNSLASSGHHYVNSNHYDHQLDPELNHPYLNSYPQYSNELETDNNLKPLDDEGMRFLEKFQQYSRTSAGSHSPSPSLYDSLSSVATFGEEPDYIHQGDSLFLDEDEEENLKSSTGALRNDIWGVPEPNKSQFKSKAITPPISPLESNVPNFAPAIQLHSNYSASNKITSPFNLGLGLLAPHNLDPNSSQFITPTSFSSNSSNFSSEFSKGSSNLSSLKDEEDALLVPEVLREEERQKELSKGESLLSKLFGTELSPLSHPFQPNHLLSESHFKSLEEIENNAIQRQKNSFDSLPNETLKNEEKADKSLKIIPITSSGSFEDVQNDTQSSHAEKEKKNAPIQNSTQDFRVSELEEEENEYSHREFYSEDEEEERKIVKMELKMDKEDEEKQKLRGPAYNRVFLDYGKINAEVEKEQRILQKKSESFGPRTTVNKEETTPEANTITAATTGKKKQMASRPAYLGHLSTSSPTLSGRSPSLRGNERVLNSPKGEKKDNIVKAASFDISKDEKKANSGVGYQMLLKLGWAEGKGIGKHLNGVTVPVSETMGKLKPKLDREGLNEFRVQKGEKNVVHTDDLTFISSNSDLMVSNHGGKSSTWFDDPLSPPKSGLESVNEKEKSLKSSEERRERASSLPFSLAIPPFSPDSKSTLSPKPQVSSWEELEGSPPNSPRNSPSQKSLSRSGSQTKTPQQKEESPLANVFNSKKLNESNNLNSMSSIEEMTVKCEEYKEMFENWIRQTIQDAKRDQISEDVRLSAMNKRLERLTVALNLLQTQEE